MATAPRKSLASRAGAVARKVVSRGPAPDPEVAAAGAKKAAPATSKKAAAKKTPVKKAAATKAPAKKAAAKKAPAKKTPVKKAVGQAPDPATADAKATQQAVNGGANGGPGRLVVLEAEDPWTKAELKQVRVQLEDDVERLTAELAEIEEDLAGMIENSGEGAGNDQADVGSASFERDQEMVIVNNARDMLEQSGHALERMADGTYGKCENCGNPIGKNRLMAFPRATLCLICKQREERR